MANSQSATPVKLRGHSPPRAGWDIPQRTLSSLERLGLGGRKYARQLPELLAEQTKTGSYALELWEVPSAHIASVVFVSKGGYHPITTAVMPMGGLSSSQ